MRKLLSLTLGLTLGATLGALIVLFLTPVSGERFRKNLRLGFEEAMIEARLASAAKRAELEAEFQHLNNGTGTST